jgi:ankyrin repeat protein
VEEGRAEVDSRDCESRTPLSWAAFYGRVEAVRWLVEEGRAEVTWKW